MTNSSAGDQMAISVDRRGSGPATTIAAKGYFNIKKTCAKTGEVTDFSGSNAIMQDALDAMLRGFTSIDGTVATFLALRFSGDSSTDFTPGNDASIPAALGDLVAGTDTVARTGDYFCFNSGTVGSPVQANIFDGKTLDKNTSGKVFIVANPIQVTNNHGSLSRTVNCIAIVDDTGTDRLFAVRSVQQTTTSASDYMAAVVLDPGDSLTVTYTIEVSATA